MYFNIRSFTLYYIINNSLNFILEYKICFNKLIYDDDKIESL